MTEEERFAAAGEYVLGTLPPPERAAFAARIAGERAAADAVLFWERMLAPLLGLVAEVAPPARVWEAVRARIGDGAAVANDRGGASGSWRAAALGLGALAAGLGAFLIARPAPKPVIVERQIAVTSPAPRYIAALNSGGQASALLLTLDPATGGVVAHPVKLTAPARRDLELWWIADGAKPSPVGILDPARPLRARVVAAKVDGGAFAVSVEPIGGSTTGAPTGPIIYTGAVVRTES